MDIKNEYKLNKNITPQLLEKNGFKDNMFRCCIYKNIIQFIVFIDTENKKWDYKVYDTNLDRLYTPYYDRGYGINIVTIKLDKNIRSIMNAMIKKRIFKKDV